jgi:dipeptide transport system substrate-binding protein
VVCTEASPEGFDIVQYTTAVTADASAETVFNRLVDFKPGTTESSRPWPPTGTSARTA